MDICDHTAAWDYATLPANVRLGDGCYIEDRGSFRRFRSTRDPGLVLGNRVRVYHWSAFSIEPEGLVEVGDDSTLAGAIFWCADHIVIGRRVVISYNVMIADSDFHPRDPELRRQDAIAIAPGGDLSRRPAISTRPVWIEDDVQIGIGAMLLKGAHVGAGARIGPGAVVTGDVAPGATVIGNPARMVEPGVLVQ